MKTINQIKIFILIFLFAVCGLSQAFGQDLIRVKGENGKYGYTDSKGNLVIPYKYAVAGKFSEGRASVWEKGKGEGFIDKNDITVIPLMYNNVDEFHEGLAAVKLNKKWGYIDKQGKVVIPFVYERVREFSEGLAAVEPVFTKGFGYINKKGELVIPVQFTSAYSFEDGVALVSTATQSALHIDKAGKFLDGNAKNESPIAASKASTNVQNETTSSYAKNGNNKALTPEKIPYTEEEKNNLKIAKDAGNWEYMGFLYIKHGYIDEGAALVKKAIAKGDCFNCEAGLAYALYISGFPKNVVQACESAAEKLNNPATVNAAIATLRKLDTQDNIPMAAYYLAGGFANGAIHPQQIEIDSAIYYYQKAAIQRYPPAMYALGEVYQYGNSKGIPVPTDRNKYAYLIDKKRARYWYGESAKSGNKSAQQKVEQLDKALAAAAVTDASDAYTKGYNAFEAQNYDEAYRWWKISALQGQDADAYFGLAILHESGKVPGYSYTTAMEYFQKAADLGMKNALAEKQKIQDYLDAVSAARQRAATAATTTSTVTAKGESYEEWWEKTYGRGGSQNRSAMPNNNIPQATYRTGTVSEADRHQRAMDAIQRSIERQQNRDYSNRNR